MPRKELLSSHCQISERSEKPWTQTPRDAFDAITDGLREKAVIPRGPQIDDAIRKAAEVLTAKKGVLHDRMDEFLGMLLVQFPGQPRRYDIALVLTDPSHRHESVPVNIIPVMLLSEVLPKRRLDLMRCSNWPPFVERYGSAVLAS